jgi:hypothetical protein
MCSFHTSRASWWGGEANSFVESWPPVLMVVFEPPDEESISAQIPVPVGFVVPSRNGPRAAYRLVPHVRRSGVRFAGHTTARVRTGVDWHE